MVEHILEIPRLVAFGVKCLRNNPVFNKDDIKVYWDTLLRNVVKLSLHSSTTSRFTSNWSYDFLSFLSFDCKSLKELLIA